VRSKRYQSLITTAALAAFSSSLFADQPRGVIEHPEITPEEFLSPYDKAWKSLESTNETIGKRELVHLGLPTDTSIVIWYALAEDAQRTDDFRLVALKSDGSETDVPPETVRHEFNPTHAVGRIEVSQLTPGSKHQFVPRGGGFSGTKTVVAETKPSQPAAFSFLVGSCFQPWNFSSADETYLTEETTSILRAFSERAQSRQKTGNGPSFYLGLGDQIYVDPGAGKNARIAYLHGKRSEKMRGSLKDTPKVLRALYRYHLGLLPMDEALSKLPSAMMWDDHDIRDGWGSQDDEGNRSWQKYYSMAREAFVAFQAARNPAYNLPGSRPIWGTFPGRAPQPTGTSELHFSFTWSNADFFVVDGRSNRNYREGEGMSEEQLGAVDRWLEALAQKRDEPRLVVFCFPVPLAGGESITGALAAKINTEGRDDARERPYILEKERSRLLEALYGHVRANRKHRLLILSGDVHYSGIQLLRNTADGDLLGYEIVSSGLAQTKFNSDGPFWLTVGREEYGVKLENYGFYAGPSFAEIFLDPGDSSAAPKLKVLFYPAAERSSRMRGTRLKQNTTLNLKVSGITADFAPDLEKGYPPNKVVGTVFRRQRTRSRLAEFLILDHWLKTGRAERGPHPSTRARKW
jgi:hypothetical protein